MKPIVDGLERKGEVKLQVIRLDLLSPVGRAAARHYRVWLIPTLILLDGQGQEVKRQLELFDFTIG